MEVKTITRGMAHSAMDRLLVMVVRGIKKYLLVSCVAFFVLILLIVLLSPIASLLSHIWIGGGGRTSIGLYGLAYHMRLLGNTLLIVLSVGLGVCFVGSALAWWMTLYEFPGKNLLRYLLLLPISIPVYICGYVYHVHSCQGVQSKIYHWLCKVHVIERATFSYWYNCVIVILIFIFSFYPYVYILTFNKLKQLNDVMMIARTSGYRGFRLFWHMLLSGMRPALFLGVVLVIMETITEYGVVSYYGLENYITSIHRLWFCARDYTSAARVSVMLFGVIGCLLFLESVIRYKTDFIQDSVSCSHTIRLPALRAFFVTLFASTCVFLGFIFPLLQLIIWSCSAVMVQPMAGGLWRLLSYAKNSVTISFLTAVIAVLITFFMGIIVKKYKELPYIAMLTRALTMGYAIPGSVLAIGIVTLFASAQKAMTGVFGMPFAAAALNGSVVGVVYACVYRFLAVAYSSMGLRFKNIRNEIDWSISVYASARFQRYKEYFPLVFGNIVTAFALVFVDSVKELPATLIIRPFNFETLVTRLHELVSDERYEASALPALLVVLISLSCLSAVFFLTREMEKKHGR